MLSVGSFPVIALSNSAASRTVRVMGPGVSWFFETVMIPLRLKRPRLGFRPTTPFMNEGQ